MLTLATVALVVVGLLLLPWSIWPCIGCVILACGISRSAQRDEEAFVGLLMVLGGLGGAAEFVLWAWTRITG